MGYGKMLRKVRGLPTPLLVLVVLSRFVFGVGLGAYLASVIRTNWKLIGGLTMGAGAAMALPVAKKVLTK